MAKKNNAQVQQILTSTIKQLDQQIAKEKAEIARLKASIDRMELVKEAVNEKLAALKVEIPG